MVGQHCKLFVTLFFTGLVVLSLNIIVKCFAYAIHMLNLSIEK